MRGQSDIGAGILSALRKTEWRSRTACQRHGDNPFNQYIQKNFSDLEFSRDNLFAKLKAGILESNKTGIPQKYIDEFLEIEEERKRIIEQNKLSIAKWETKMKLDNQNKNKAPDNKE